MTLDNRTADREPDAQAMRFSRVERFEQLRDLARIKADAGVPNPQFDAVAAINLRLNSERSRPILNAGHRISSIQQQVQDDLLQLHAIATDGRQRFRKVCLQHRATAP
jgi:hypothetical protein